MLVSQVLSSLQVLWQHIPHLPMCATCPTQLILLDLTMTTVTTKHDDRDDDDDDDDDRWRVHVIMLLFLWETQFHTSIKLPVKLKIQYSEVNNSKHAPYFNCS